MVTLNAKDRREITIFVLLLYLAASMGSVIFLVYSLFYGHQDFTEYQWPSAADTAWISLISAILLGIPLFLLRRTMKGKF